MFIFCFFFFQAEDGIRDVAVTGVQTCALPILSDIVRVVVPMCYYSHIRRVTLVANLVQTVDGKKAEARAAEDAAMKLAGDIEFDLFRGKADFSNAGVFDGNP